MESSAAQVFPRVVMATPAMLMKTATTFDTFKESWPKRTPMNRVKRPEVDDSTVVLATLVLARAAFDKYCNAYNTVNQHCTVPVLLYEALSYSYD